MAVICEVMERDRYRCQFFQRPFSHDQMVPMYPAHGGPLDPHEIVPRSAWHDGQYEPTNVIAICRVHHQWIDNHPTLAHELGLHGFSYERPDQ